MTAVNLVIGIAFLGMGTSYLAIGLANRDKWKKKMNIARNLEYYYNRLVKT